MPLRLTFAGVLEATFLIFRRDFRTFLVIGLVTQIPLLLFNLLVGASVPRGIQTTATGFLLEIIPTFLIGVVYRAAVIRTAEGPYQGEAVSAGMAIRLAFSVYGRLALASALFGLATGALMIVLVVPGVWFYFAYVLVSPVVILEGRGAFAALRRAGHLARGAWARLMGAVVITSILTGIPEGIMNLLARKILPSTATAQGLVAGAPNAVIGFVAVTLLGAISPIALTVLYHDRTAALAAAKDTLRDGTT